MLWRKMNPAGAEAVHGLGTPDRATSTLYVATTPGWTLWAYRGHKGSPLARGNKGPFLFWVRRDSDHMEWNGGAETIWNAQIGARALWFAQTGGDGQN